MIKIRKIARIKAKDDFMLECLMENGEVFSYDMSFLKRENGEMAIPLKDPGFFNQVFLELGHLSWPNGYEIHANTVTRDGTFIVS